MKKIFFCFGLAAMLFCSQTNEIVAQKVTENLKLKGTVSADIENINKEADPKFVPVVINPESVKSKGSSNRKKLSELEQGMAIVTNIVNRLIQREYSFALLSGHKYMVNSCLGLKVSSGQFDLKFANPEIGITGGKFSVKLEIDKIKFSALKIRSRPRVPDFSDPDPCHFSGKFEIGGEATDVSVRVTLDLVAVATSGAAAYCALTFGEPSQITWKIGGFNLRPVPNVLDNMAKEMVEDALNNGMIDLVYNRLMDAAKAVLPEYFDACEAQEKMGRDLENVSNPATAENNPPKTDQGKWVITPVPTMKGVLGKLNTQFSEGADWSIDIRTAAENKFITNRSSYSKHGPLQDIAPGTYNFQLNTILVENVPIEKGKETRLKAGILNIVSEGRWELRSENKEKFHTSGSKPKKIVLPVGNYQVKLGTQFFPVIIKDEETVEY